MIIASNNKQSIYNVIVTATAHSLKLVKCNKIKVHSSLQVTNIQTIDQKSLGMCVRNQANIIDMVTCSDVWRNNCLLSRSNRAKQYRAQKNIVVTKIHHLQIPQPVKNHARALEMWLYPQKPCCKDEDSQVGFRRAQTNNPSAYRSSCTTKGSEPQRASGD
jgi:hypothetical protein